MSSQETSRPEASSDTTTQRGRNVTSAEADETPVDRVIEQVENLGLREQGPEPAATTTSAQQAPPQDITEKETASKPFQSPKTDQAIEAAEPEQQVEESSNEASEVPTQTDTVAQQSESSQNDSSQLPISSEQPASTLTESKPDIPAESQDGPLALGTAKGKQSAGLDDPATADNGQHPPAVYVTGKRQALADSSTVAAIAHAFGRDSPALPTGDPINDHASNKTLPAFTGQDSSSVEPKSSSNSEAANAEAVAPSSRGIKIGKGPPPTTQASEELPFDFNRFLEQMKHRSAQPVGEYVRSFIKGFAKKPYRTQDQIKLIFDFLDFISARMRECEVWEHLGETDFENAKEAMEKLVMNRLYPYTFTPAVQKEGRWAVQSDDLERDRILKQRISLFVWLREEHLDIPVGDHSRGFIEFSIQELNKINHYKAPRDKLICILNCCKVIFGMIRHLSSQENADTFIPVLIFVVLKANPNNLISNVEYISRFRNPDRLSSESGYYLSSLMGAISFIETMDCNSLSNITQEEFESKVEEAMSALPLPEPEPQPARSSLFTSISTPPRSLTPSQGPPDRQRTVSSTSVSSPAGPGDESAKALPFTPIAGTLADDTRAFFQRTGEAARTGLSRPMGALGRLFNEGIEGIRTPSNLDSGASTERNNSPVPPPAQGSTSMTASTSRSRIFAGLFGSAEGTEPSGSVRSVSSSGQRNQQANRGPVGLDDEPPTPSTDGLTQEGFVPYTEKPGNVQNAAARLLRPSVPQRGYSIDDAVFDDEMAGRRNLIATRDGREKGDDRDYDDDDDYDHGGQAEETPNAAALQRAKRRRQMQQDFGADSLYPGTPSRSRGADVDLQPGGREAQAYESAQTEEAIQQSLMEQEELGAVQAQTEAQNSAGVETLKSIFPTMDQGVIQMVLHGCEGNVELAIDRLLEMQ